MSKKRNRNIQSLNFETHKLNEKKSMIRDYSPPFYKPEKDTASLYSLGRWNRRSTMSTENVDLLIGGLNRFNFTKCLSSSPSWSDDNDESCRRVQDELERMDRVLRGIEPIPLNYDVEEYKEWMETFPNISLFGNKKNGPYKIWRTSGGMQSASSSRSKNSSLNLKAYKEEIKKAVIHNIYENISIRLTGSTPVPMERNKNSARSSINKTQSYLKNCLKISPFTQAVQETRRFSNKSRQENYDSLPIMVEEQNLSSHYSGSQGRIKKNKKAQNVVLPPIESHVRSISATPIHPLLSAKSVRLENKMLSGKIKHNFEKY